MAFLGPLADSLRTADAHRLRWPRERRRWRSWSSDRPAWPPPSVLISPATGLLLVAYVSDQSGRTRTDRRPAQYERLRAWLLTCARAADLHGRLSAVREVSRGLRTPWGLPKYRPLRGPAPRRRRARVQLVGVKGGGLPPSRSDAVGALDAGQLYSIMTAAGGGADPCNPRPVSTWVHAVMRVAGYEPAASSSRTRIGLTDQCRRWRSRRSGPVCSVVWRRPAWPGSAGSADSLLTRPRPPPARGCPGPRGS